MIICFGGLCPVDALLFIGQLVPVVCALSGLGGAATMVFECTGCGIKIDYLSSAVCTRTRHCCITCTASCSILGGHRLCWIPSVIFSILRYCHCV